MGLLTEWAESNRVFRRNKKSGRSKLLAAVLCASGYSYRYVASLLGGISYVGVRDAYLAVLSFCPDETPKPRRAVAIDESRAVIGIRDAYFWLARDIDSGEVISFRCSFTGSPEDSAEFCLSILHRCTTRPIVRLGKGDNYPKGLKNLDLQFEVEAQPAGGITQLFKRLFFSGRT
jgi:hypothetical protein